MPQGGAAQPGIGLPAHEGKFHCKWVVNQQYAQWVCFDKKGAAVSVKTYCRIGIGYPITYGDCFEDMGPTKPPVGGWASLPTQAEVFEAAPSEATIGVKVRNVIEGVARGYRTKAPSRKRRRR